MAFYSRAISNSPSVYYDMNRPCLAVIFNHREFQNRDFKPRDGTEKDVESLRKCLEYLNFEIQSYDNLKFDEIQKKLTEVIDGVSKEKISCLMIIVLTHGELGKLHAYDTSYAVDDLWKDLVPAKCPQLMGVPKLFFIEACRGEMVDFGEIQYDSTMENQSIKLPAMVDFLQMYSSYQGFKSLRTTLRGSLFIQSLCYILEKYAEELDLVQLLTFVNDRVVTEYQNIPGKQSPQYVCMLRKLLKFRIQGANPELMTSLNTFKSKALPYSMPSEIRNNANKFNLKEDLAIGIDFGSNVCAAVLKDGELVACLNESEEQLIPAWICFDDKALTVGQKAMDNSVKYIKRTVFDPQRMIGLNYEQYMKKDFIKHDPNSITFDKKLERIIVEIRINNEIRSYHPHEISGFVLNNVKNYVERYLGRSVKNAVITVPSDFNIEQRRTTMEAARLAGFNVLRIINESSAAALAYNLIPKNSPTKTILVSNMRGTTIDVGIIRIREQEINVVATKCGQCMGNDYFVKNVYKHCMDEFQKNIGRTLNQFEVNCPEKLRFLELSCENAIIDLLSSQESSIQIDSFIKGVNLDVTISIDQFESINEELFRKILDLFKQCLEDAKLKPEDINDIVLVGESTRIPRFEEKVGNHFSGIPISKSLDPDTAVAKGAAVLAEALMRTEIPKEANELLVEVTPHSIGVELKDGIMDVVIPKNTPLPVERVEKYKTKSFSKSIYISIFEGENEKVKNNKVIGKFKVCRPNKKFSQIFEYDAKFCIDKNNVLIVRCSEPNSDQFDEFVIGKLWNNQENIDEK